MRSHRLPLILLGATLLLAACRQGAAAPTAAPTLPPPTPTDVPATATPTEVQEASPATSPPEPTAEGLGPIPQGSSQLKASNPTHVDLSAGKPTLVEFFAFW